MTIAMPLRVPIGICNVMTFTVFFPLNVLLIWVIARHGDLKKLWAYKIITHIAVTDLIILFIVVSTGTLSVMDYSSRNFLSQLCYSLSLSIKLTGTLLSFTLAFNRLFVMLEIKLFDRGLVYWTMVGISWLVGIFLLIFFLCTLPETFYIPSMHRFESDYVHTLTYSMWSSLVQTLVFIVSGVIYVLIGVKITWRRASVSTQEIWLSIQAMLPFIWFLVTELLMFIKLRVHFDDDVFAITFMFFSRYIPVVHITTYMALNRTLRKEMLAVLGVPKTCRKKVNVVANTISSQISRRHGLRCT